MKTWTTLSNSKVTKDSKTMGKKRLQTLVLSTELLRTIDKVIHSKSSTGMLSSKESELDGWKEKKGKGSRGKSRRGVKEGWRERQNHWKTAACSESCMKMF